MEEMMGGESARWRASMRRLWVLGTLLLAVACADSGEGCGGGCGSGCDTTPYPENAPSVDGGLQIRLARPGLDFIEDNIEPIIAQVLEGGLTFCLPAGDDPVTLCDRRTCSTGETGCELSLELLDVQAAAVEPGGLEVTAVVGGLDPETDFIEVQILSNCIVRLGTRDNAGLPISLSADFTVDEQTGDVSVALDESSVSVDFDALEIDIDAESFLDIFICEGADLLTGIGFIRDLLFDNVVGPLLGDLFTATDEFLCRSCEANENCPSGATCQEGICRVDGGECVPGPLGLEGALDFGALVASISPGLEAELAYQIKVHGWADAVNEGLSLGAKGGAYGDKAECVPAVAPPSTLTVPQSEILRGNTGPGGRPYHLGIGISKAFVDEALWGAFNGGALCLTIGTSAVELLSSGTFGTLLPSLKELTRNQNTPLILRLMPQRPPTADFGAGTVDPETGDLLEPLITLQWPDLNIEFLAFFDDRMVRFMTLNVDLEIPVALEVADGGLVPVIGDLSSAFSRVEVVDSALLTEEDAFITGLLPTLVNIALPLLGDSLSDPIELPSFSGFAIDITQDSLTSIEGDSMLGLFANLALAPDAMEQAHPRIETSLELIDLVLPPVELFEPGPAEMEGQRAEALMTARPVATFQARASLWGEALDEELVEYSVRLNGGMWSLFRHDPLIVVDDPVLLLQGEHTFEVRARLRDVPETVDLEPATLVLPIDFEGPVVSVRHIGDVIRLEGFDLVSDAHTLSWQVRLGEGQWHPWDPTQDLDLSALETDRESVELTVRVTDEAGHTTLVEQSFPIHGRVTGDDPSDSSCDCSQPGGRTRGMPGGALWLALGALGLGVVVRRRRGVVRRSRRSGSRLWALLGLLTLTVCVSACDKSEKGGASSFADTCPEGCPAGQDCVEGVCQDTVCASDDDCPDGFICLDEVCRDLEACTDSADCPDGFVCLDGACQAVDCDSDADCGEVACGNTEGVCDDGACACAAPCAQGCGEGEYCCERENSCEALPDPCAAVACEPGFRGEQTASASGDPATCEVTMGSCDCVELDPLPEGDIGRFHDAIQVGERVVVSAYNDTYGDLMVGVLESDDRFSWTFVDGLPEGGNLTGSPNGPRGGVAVRGPRVGRYTSLVADSAGNLHVTYRDDDNETLKYAFGAVDGETWRWTTHTVDDNGNVGLWSALSVGADGLPAIVYMAPAVPVEDPLRPVGLSKLRWAQAVAAEPGSSADWVFSDLDTLEVPYFCNGGCPSGQRCRADVNACERALAGSRCDGNCAEGQGCFEGEADPVCVDLLEQPDVVSLPEGVGLFARVARFANGDPAVVYYDRTGGDLRFVRVQDGAWQAPVILDGRDAENNDVTDAGTFCDIAIDAEDNVHIVYVDAIADDLRYIHLNEGISEVVDDGLRSGDGQVSLNLVGDASAILVTPDGEVRVAYQDASAHRLMLARRVEGAWQVLTVAGGGDEYTGSYGFYNQQLLVDGESLMTTYRYHRQVDPPLNGLTVHRFR